MKKFLLLALLIMLGNCVFAIADDEWGSNAFDNAWYGQKPVTDEEFEKTLSEVEAKQKKNKKKKFKGDAINQSNELFMNEMNVVYPLLNLPVSLVNEDKEIIPGHYKAVGKKSNGHVTINLYQASSLIASFPAKETKDDFDQKEIHFINIVPLNERQVKIIFGSLEFNAYSIVNLKEEQY